MNVNPYPTFSPENGLSVVDPIPTPTPPPWNCAAVTIPENLALPFAEIVAPTPDVPKFYQD